MIQGERVAALHGYIGFERVAPPTCLARLGAGTRPAVPFTSNGEDGSAPEAR